MTIGDRIISKLKGGATVSLPYRMPSGAGADQVAAWYLDDDGNITEHAHTYDPVEGSVTFVTDHFSYYGIGVPGAGAAHTAETHFLIAFAAAIAGMLLLIVFRRMFGRNRRPVPITALGFSLFCTAGAEEAPCRRVTASADRPSRRLRGSAPKERRTGRP